MTLKETLDRTIRFFKTKGIENPRVDTEYLFHHALGLSRVDLYVNFEKIMTEGELDQLRPLIQRRGKGEPVAYITGEREFYGLNFKVNTNVLIPRPETELIVDLVLDQEKSGQLPGDDLTIVDFGTGTGCIGLTLAHLIPRAKVFLIDKSEAALAVARENAKDLQVDQSVGFIEADVADINLSELGQTPQVIVANPPYISFDDKEVSSEVKASEPEMALFCEEEGYALPLQWIEKSKQLLGPSGLMVMEIGYNQGERLKDFASKEFSSFDIEIKQDYNKLDRLLVCKKLISGSNISDILN